MSEDRNSSPPDGKHTQPRTIMLRRTVLSLGISAAAGVVLTRSAGESGAGRGAADPDSILDQPTADPGSVPDTPAPRPGPSATSKSLATTHGKAARLATMRTEPYALLRRYRNVLTGAPEVGGTFFRTAQGVLKIAAVSAGLTGQVQILDAVTGTRERAIVPFPGNGGGVGATAYDAGSGTLFAYGAENTVQRVSLAGTFAKAYSSARGTSNASFAVAMDSKGRIWNGNYPTGNATRFDPVTGATAHTARLRADTQYVRALAIDPSDRVYAGTGASNPAIFTWQSDRPERVREIPLPVKLATGFVRRIEAHGDLLFVYIVGPDGDLDFRIFKPSTETWLRPSWTWMPSGMVMASPEGAEYAYAVMSEGSIHKLMRINLSTLGVSTVCRVPAPPKAIELEQSGSETILNLFCGSAGNYRVIKVSASARSIIRDVPVDVLPRTFRLQSLVAPGTGDKVYFGGYLGDGIGSLDLSRRRTWRSAPQAGIRQVEGMVEYDDKTMYLGSYTAGVIFRFNPQTGTVKKLIELRDKYQQSRPISWTVAGRRVVAGTIPEYGKSGGALIVLDPTDDSDIRVVKEPIRGQSVLGLVGDGDIVYGTTGIKGGHGSPNPPTFAHVFAWDVLRNRLLWKKMLVGEVEINSPVLLGKRLYVSTSNGVIEVDKRNGEAVATYRLLERWAAPKYRTSRIVALPRGNRILHLCGGTLTLLNFERKTRTQVLRGPYSDLVVKQSKLLLVENGTDIVEVDLSA